MEKLKVFISDDSITVRKRLLTMALDMPEIAVVGQAQDALGSLDAILQTRPDVVILDIRMPGGGGINVLREVKKMNPAPKVIMLTNFSYGQYRTRCEQAGADFFFDKSTEFDQIPLALEQVRRGLRAVPPRTSDPPAQTSDTSTPTKGGLAPGSKEKAGARRGPDHPGRLMWAVLVGKRRITG